MPAAEFSTTRRVRPPFRCAWRVPAFSARPGGAFRLGLTAPVVLYDPVLRQRLPPDGVGHLHAEQIDAVLASDIDLQHLLTVAERDLSLLTLDSHRSGGGAACGASPAVREGISRRRARQVHSACWNG